MGNFFVVCLSGLFLLFGSIKSAPRAERALIFSKERDLSMMGQSPLGSGSREGQNEEGDQEEVLLSRYFSFDYPYRRNQQEPIFFRPTIPKRHDKGILLDVGDFVMNGGPNSGMMKGDNSQKSFLLKSPSSVLRVGGMMRNSG